MFIVHFRTKKRQRHREKKLAELRSNGNVFMKTKPSTKKENDIWTTSNNAPFYLKPGQMKNREDVEKKKYDARNIGSLKEEQQERKKRYMKTLNLNSTRQCFKWMIPAKTIQELTATNNKLFRWNPFLLNEKFSIADWPLFLHFPKARASDHELSIQIYCIFRP